MYQEFFKNVSKIAFLVSAYAAMVFIFLRQWLWVYGIFVGFFWNFLNVFFLFKLIELVMKHDQKNKSLITRFALIKFPILYLGGYFILKSQTFPIGSILLGLSVFMLVLTGHWLHLNYLSKKSS